jgi:hypothetical protein
MIEIGAFEEITQIRMSREIGGKPAYIANDSEHDLPHFGSKLRKDLQRFTK